MLQQNRLSFSECNLRNMVFRRDPFCSKKAKESQLKKGDMRKSIYTFLGLCTFLYHTSTFATRLSDFYSIFIHFNCKYSSIFLAQLLLR